MTKFSALLSSLAVTIGAAALPLTASSFEDGGMVQFELMEGWQTQRGSRVMGLKVSLADGWHTYWRSPGDAGIPPQLTVLSADNLVDIDIHWPKPEVFDQNGMRYVGYEGVVIFPIELTLQSPGPVSFEARLDLGVCEEICIPMSVDLAATVTPDTTGENTQAIRAAYLERPKPLGSVTCAIAPIEDGLRVTANVPTKRIGTAEHAVIEVPDQTIWISEAILNDVGTSLLVESELVPEEAMPFSLSRSDVTVTVFSNDHVYEANGCTKN